MFKKLISNLPFNPSLFDQLSFYSNRMRADAAIRRAGFIFMSLAFVVQLVAALYPAQNSLAASPNDVLEGANTKSILLKGWDDNASNVREVYSRFGISRDSLAAIHSETPDMKIKSTDSDYWTVGHRPLSDYGVSSSHWGERTVDTGSSNVYQRPLHAFDTDRPSSTYDAFHAKASDGADVYILKGSGCPTTHGPHLPTPPSAKLSVHKNLLTGATAHPGDTVKFRLEYQNTVHDSLANHFNLSDVIDSHFEFVSLSNMSSHSGNTVNINHGGSLGYSATPYTATLEVKVKSTAAAGTVICNSASATSTESSVTSPEKPCVTVVSSQPPTQASAYCVATAAFVSGSNKDFVLHTAVYASAGIKISSYSYFYDVDANGSIDATDKVNETPHDKTFTGLATGNHKIAVKVDLVHPNGEVYHTATCPVEVTIGETPRAVLTKSVTNVTRGGDANGGTVNAGDVLEFKLNTKNVTASDYKNYKGQDYFGSVLQYANLDSAQLPAQGITIGADNYLHWTTANLKANSTDVKTIRVQVKSPVPTTNSPSHISPEFNCKISNDYGNQVTMSVNCPLVKTIASTTTTLPNTGPGTSVIIAGLVAIAVGYLYARSRLLARELDIARQSYVSSGGL